MTTDENVDDDYRRIQDIEEDSNVSLSGFVYVPQDDTHENNPHEYGYSQKESKYEGVWVLRTVR